MKPLLLYHHRHPQCFFHLFTPFESRMPLCSNSNDTYIKSAKIQLKIISGDTYHKLGEYQHCQSFWTPHCHPYRDHQFRNGRQQYAEKKSVEANKKLLNKLTPITLSGPINLMSLSVVEPLPLP
jgi:hypothetical protein